MKYVLIYILLLLFTFQLKAQDILIYGNTKTLDQVILRELSEDLTYETLHQDRAWLQRLDFLKRVDFVINPNHDFSKDNLIIVVQEKSVFKIVPIIDNHDVYGWLGGVEFTQRNIWGRRESITFSVETGKRKTFKASYKEPWFAGNLHLMSEITVSYCEADYLYEDYSPHFSMKQKVGSFKLGKGWGRYFQGGVEFGLESMVTDDIQVTLSDKLEDHLYSKGIYFNWDNRDWPEYPAKGWLISFKAFESNINSMSFRRGIFELNYFKHIHNKQILAIQFFYEGSEGDTPVYKRIHLGGVKSLRGYKAGQFGGNHMFFNSTEYRFPMFYLRHPDEGVHLGWLGYVFWDVGSTWYGTRDFSSFRLHHSAGIGIHALLDSWKLRLEYGQLFRGSGYISAGTSFKF